MKDDERIDNVPFVPEAEDNGQDAWELLENTEAEYRFDQREVKRTFSRVGFGIALFAIVAVCASDLLGRLIYWLSPDVYNSDMVTFFLFSFCLYCIALPILLIVYSTHKPRTIEKKKMGVGEWLILLLVCMGVMRIGAVIGTIATLGIEAILGYDTYTGLESLISLDTNPWIIFVAVVIIAPIGEEFVFRKLMIDRLAKFGCFPSVFLSALAFGLMHGNFSQFFYAFGVGLVFGYIYYYTGRVWYTVAMHAVVNFLGSIVSLWLSESLLKFYEVGADADLIQLGPDVMFIMLFFMFVITTMVASVAIPIIFIKSIKLDKGDSPIPGGRFASSVFANVGVIVMLAVLAGRFIISYL